MIVVSITEAREWKELYRKRNISKLDTSRGSATSEIVDYLTVGNPSNVPSVLPSYWPSRIPTKTPSSVPTNVPSIQPSFVVQNIEKNNTCNNGTALYYIILEDSQGDGWEGVYFQLYDQKQPNNVTMLTAPAGRKVTYVSKCLGADKCYTVNTTIGSRSPFHEENSFEIGEAIFGQIDPITGFPVTKSAVAKGGTPRVCQFSIPKVGESGNITYACNTTCLGYPRGE